MIPCQLKTEPDDFDDKVRKRGLEWLEAHPDPSERPKNFWSAVAPALAAAFSDRCAYSAMYEPSGQVDHFLSCCNPKRPENRKLAYEWSNYRYATGWINSKKGNLDYAVLDPFKVQDGWFEIALPSLELRVTDRCPTDFRDKAEFTLVKLGLRNDRRIVRQRQKWLQEYEQTRDIGILERNAPLLAAAVRKAQATT